MRAFLGALLIAFAQIATAAHAAGNDHDFTAAHEELCLLCLHGARHDGAPLPEAASVCGSAKLSFASFSIPQDRLPVRASVRAHGARGPPLHSSTA